jgi:nitrate reductase gamma subunit
MSLEVLFFRSLFRNNKAEIAPGPSLAYASSKWLWMAGLIFHWSLLVIVLRHYRFFLASIPGFVEFLESIDGFLQITLPTLYITDLLLVLAVTFLVLRRLASAQMRIISLSTDYFPLFLILAIALSGISMRYLDKVDIVAVKVLVQGLVSFQFDAPGAIGAIFYVHLFLVCVLASYFPFSKLMHMGGIFLSPTRNLANNSREKRHINPWNPEVKFRTYKEYEDEFREKMVKADLPTEVDLPIVKE